MKSKLLSGAAIVALVAMAAAPAQAFDENVWTWTKTVDEVVNITVDINSELNPTGHVEIQDAQFYTGDVVARTSAMGEHLSNDASGPGDVQGTVTVPVELPVSGNVNLSGTFDANASQANITSADLDASGLEGFEITNAAVGPDSAISVQPSEFNFDLAIEGTASGEQEIDLSTLDLQAVTLDAASNLGNVAGSATAIANFKNIETEAATFLDESQVQEAANAAGDGFGILAESTAGDVENPVEVAVELDATAISNLLTVSSAVSDSDNVFIGDVSQETNANLLAEASTVQDLRGFNNLGNFQGLTDADGNAIAGRVATLTATAIGNFADIKIGPSVDLTGN